MKIVTEDELCCCRCKRRETQDWQIFVVDFVGLDLLSQDKLGFLHHRQHPWLAILVTIRTNTKAHLSKITRASHQIVFGGILLYLF